MFMIKIHSKSIHFYWEENVTFGEEMGFPFNLLPSNPDGGTTLKQPKQPRTAQYAERRLWGGRAGSGSKVWWKGWVFFSWFYCDKGSSYLGGQVFGFKATFLGFLVGFLYCLLTPQRIEKKKWFNFITFFLWFASHKKRLEEFNCNWWDYFASW